jgi:SAM-dependent methyltransferase
MVWESESGDDVARARELAVAKHDREASEFDEEYRILTEDGYLATAFLLGREKIDRIVYRELGRYDRSARILDAGCGTGSQVGEIRDLGFEVSGLEPASEMRRLAIAANPGVDIRDGSITALPYDD